MERSECTTNEALATRSSLLRRAQEARSALITRDAARMARDEATSRAWSSIADIIILTIAAAVMGEELVTLIKPLF